MSQLFEYKTSMLINSLLPGGHPSRQRGPGADFYRKTLFLDEPEPARIDLHASLRDPFENLQVRSYRQRSKLDVQVFVDGSSSMLYDRKVALTQTLFESIYLSVASTGDNFSSYLLTDEMLAIAKPETLKAAFNELQPLQNQASAYTQVYRALPARPSLIFLISDFHWPEMQIQALLAAMSAHVIVPVIIWQSQEYNDYPLWRFVEMTDLETGENRLIFITRKQKALLHERYRQRREYLNACCRAFNQRPFWLQDHYDPIAMNHYFASQY